MKEKSESANWNRQDTRFPPFPSAPDDIWDYSGHGEYMACAIVHSYSVRQILAFRKLRLKLGEQAFREAMIEAMDILKYAKTIDNPAAWFYCYIRQEIPQ